MPPSDRAASSCLDQGANVRLPGVVELASGVDAFYLSGHGELSPVLLDELDVLRNRAAELGQPVDWSLGGTPVKVLGRAFLKYRYAIRHELAMIGMTPSASLPAVRVQPTSLAIHALGPETTVLWVRNLLDAAGITARLQVARLDLHADWQHFNLGAEERQNFVTYSNRRALYEVDEALSGLNFGTRGGAVYARIYDKTRELETKGDDFWLDIWADKLTPDLPVTRVEFEFSREGLRDFDIDTPEDAFDAFGPLWAYATGNWLSLRVPTGDDTRSRWPVDDRWQAIQRATLAGNSLPAERVRVGQAAGSLRKLMPQLVGCLTSAAAHLGTDTAADTCTALLPLIDNYCSQGGTTFAGNVSDKRLKL